MRVKNSPLSIVLLGLEERIASDLTHLLVALNHKVSHSSKDLNSADLVFCDREAVKDAAPAGAPLVAVSPEATESAWLAALDQGADDYLPFPYEPRELHWILESHSRRPIAATAGA